VAALHSALVGACALPGAGDGDFVTSSRRHGGQPTATPSAMFRQPGFRVLSPPDVVAGVAHWRVEVQQVNGADDGHYAAANRRSPALLQDAITGCG
jgi:hypothetical protein